MSLHPATAPPPRPPSPLRFRQTRASKHLYNYYNVRLRSPTRRPKWSAGPLSGWPWTVSLTRPKTRGQWERPRHRLLPGTWSLLPPPNEFFPARPFNGFLRDAFKTPLTRLTPEPAPKSPPTPPNAPLYISISYMTTTRTHGIMCVYNVIVLLYHVYRDMY